jgi:2-polyprenyl-3-methyl-5-hydroxy-6-metoxy-1,4-benzoquinol methylase
MDKWILPENLKKSEAIVRVTELSSLDPKNDFASYKIMLETGDFNTSMISNHNDIAPYEKIKIFKQHLQKHKLFNSQQTRILNLGCGLGFETKAIADVFDSETMGIDISIDAISFAKKKFGNQRISFECIGVDENLQLEQKYDICFAIEFYPFSRTDNIDKHSQIIKAIFNNLSSNGILVIYQVWDNEYSIKNNIVAIEKLVNKKAYVSGYMHKKVNTRIGDNFISVIVLKLMRHLSALFGKSSVKPARMVIFR